MLFKAVDKHKHVNGQILGALKKLKGAAHHVKQLIQVHGLKLNYFGPYAEANLHMEIKCFNGVGRIEQNFSHYRECGIIERNLNRLD